MTLGPNFAVLKVLAKLRNFVKACFFRSIKKRSSIQKEIINSARESVSKVHPRSSSTLSVVRSLP